MILPGKKCIKNAHPAKKPGTGKISGRKNRELEIY
jgi:hypothetical protein